MSNFLFLHILAFTDVLLSKPGLSLFFYTFAFFLHSAFLSHPSMRLPNARSCHGCYYVGFRAFLMLAYLFSSTYFVILPFPFTFALFAACIFHSIVLLLTFRCVVFATVCVGFHQSGGVDLLYLFNTLFIPHTCACK